MSGMGRSSSIEREVSDEAIRQYLDGIGSYQLLTAEDEVRLAKAIETGHKADIALESETDPTKRRQLGQMVRAGVEARQTFIRSNLRLVVSIAKRYGHARLPFLDLVQEGNLGLIRAVEKFEYRKGFKFSTYATWWIRQSITRGLGNQGRTIRLPVHMIDVVRTVQETDLALQERYRRKPTIEEIAGASGLDEDQVVIAMAAPGETVSLDRPVSTDGDAQLGDFVEDERTPDPFAVAADLARCEEIARALALLDDREGKVLMMRYGIGGGSPRTLSDVGGALGITRERVRQIENRALSKLRDPGAVLDLRSLL